MVEFRETGVNHWECFIEGFWRPAFMITTMVPVGQKYDGKARLTSGIFKLAGECAFGTVDEAAEYARQFLADWFPKNQSISDAVTVVHRKDLFHTPTKGWCGTKENQS